MKRLKLLGGVLLLLVAGGAGLAFWTARRPLPVVDGTIAVSGPKARIEIVRDRWGIPHIFAQDDEDAAFGLGWVTAQDRLFHLELIRHAAQGRLSELFGPDLVKVDRLFRTMDFHGIGKRMLGRARPETRRALEAYARGANACVASRPGVLPVEFVLLGHDFAPVTGEDFAGVVGYMTWGLNLSWEFDPAYEKLVARVGPEMAAELFPYNRGGTPSVHRAYNKKTGMDRAERAATVPYPSLFDLSQSERWFLDLLPRLPASNNWVVGPGKSTSGKPILANDPHMGHGLPGVWYQAHLQTPAMDVVGVTLPGVPFVVIGHNRRIVWGFTNVMLDAADFFVETVNPDERDEIMSKGAWAKVAAREEIIKVKGGAPVRLEVRETAHGPIVSDFFPETKEVLSYRWVYAAADDANEIDGFYDLNRARNWNEFRAAVSRFGALSQNAAYGDVDGHIGLQTTGRIPRLRGKTEGTRFRVGSNGAEEWDGFMPFEDNPSVFDPPEGWLASANNPTLPAPMPYYISSQWEPVDRYLRIAELLQAKEKLSVEDMQRIQRDTTWVSAREEAPMILAAFAAVPSPPDATVQAALGFLEGWDGNMTVDSPAAALFAVFYKHVFYETFDDELSPEITGAYRSKANLSAIMIRAVLHDGPAHWFDRQGTSAVEDKNEILRAAFLKGMGELRERLGGGPSDWKWGRVHTLLFQHPLGRVKLLAPYFNRGPFPAPGHMGTVNKMENADMDWRVQQGPSMRQITDLADLSRALAVIPCGQSGIPASPHYDDLLPLWLNGQYHPVLMDRSDIDPVAEGRLVLTP